METFDVGLVIGALSDAIGLNFILGLFIIEKSLRKDYIFDVLGILQI